MELGESVLTEACVPGSSPDCAGVCNGISVYDCAGTCYNPELYLPPHVRDCAGTCHDINLPPPHFFNAQLECVSDENLCPNPPLPTPLPPLQEDQVIRRRPLHLWILFIFLTFLTILVFLREKKTGSGK